MINRIADPEPYSMLFLRGDNTKMKPMESLPLVSRCLLTQREIIGPVYPLYVYDPNMPLTTILRQRWRSLMYDFIDLQDDNCSYGDRNTWNTFQDQD